MEIINYEKILGILDSAKEVAENQGNEVGGGEHIVRKYICDKLKEIGLEQKIEKAEQHMDFLEIRRMIGKFRVYITIVDNRSFRVISHRIRQIEE